MNWSKVRLIFSREVRDQLRDRRTLFMIFVLPMALYPLLGMMMSKVIQFGREQPTKVLVVGTTSLPDEPTLVEGNRFASRLFGEVAKADLLEVDVDEQVRSITEAKSAVEQGVYEAVIVVPEDFGTQLEKFRARLKNDAGGGKSSKDSPPANVPNPEVVFSTAKEKSQLAYVRVSRVLQHWLEEIGKQNLAESRIPESAVRPFEVTEHDVAEVEERSSAVWSKILPFLLLIWALTGAFYPAIDLCAGEKERGTLETLLSSPAERSEIVWGKLLTVMLFSLATALLNIASIGFTGAAVSSQLPQIGPPPMSAAIWLTLALLPMSAMFSALCLALAAFARSTKEGQYYLMPLVMVTLPLVVLPMFPGVELTFGNSLIPVTGVMLVLRSFLAGDTMQALPYVPLVMAVTGCCCLMAIRWAVDQFNSESVMFRESERFDVSLWLRHMLRDREDTPTVAASVGCGLLILVLMFFLSLATPAPQNFAEGARSVVVGLIAGVLTPALLMSVVMTRSPVKTLLLKRPPWLSLPAMVVLAAMLYPSVLQLGNVVKFLYPVDESQLRGLEKLTDGSLGLMLLCFALAPAIFEELAFRGFVLSGLRHSGYKWRAIIISSMFFGVAHGLVQQSIMATFTGVVLGFIAVQTGSILPGMVFHFCHNSLTIVIAKLGKDAVGEYPVLQHLGTLNADGMVEFRWEVVVASAVIALIILRWLAKLPYERTTEETHYESLTQLPQ